MPSNSGKKFVGWLVCLLLIVGLVFPYLTGSPLSYVVIVLSVILSIVGLWWGENARSDPGALMLLAALCLLAIVFAMTNRRGTTDVLSAGNFFIFALFGPLTVALRQFSRLRNMVLVASLALGGAAVALLVAIVQEFVLHMDRPEGWGSNPTQSSTTALLLGFVSLAGYSQVSSWRRNLFLLGPILGAGTVFVSGSRGPFVALPALVIVAVLLARVRPAALMASAILLIGGTTGFFMIRPEVLQRFLVLQDAAVQIGTGRQVDADISTGTRYQILEGSMLAFEKSPWIGYGWLAKTTVVTHFSGVGFDDETHSHLHSDVLNFGVSGGVVGLIAYLLAVFAPLVSAWRSTPDRQFVSRRYAGTVLSVGYLFCGLVNMLFGFEYLTTFFVSVAAILIGYCRDRPADKNEPDSISFGPVAGKL